MSRLVQMGLASLVFALPCRAADDDKWSAVKGKVVYDDSVVPVPKRVPPTDLKAANLPACAPKDKDFLTEQWVVNAKNKGVKDAFVWLAPEPTADVWKRLRATGKDRLRDFPSFKADQLHPDLKEPAAKTVEMDQPCCRFIPHVLAIRVGQTLVIKNSADFSHNAKYETDNNGSGNPIIPSKEKVEIPFKASERNVFDITCGMHPWMTASVRVFDHPYFAITGENGEYEIKKAPVGKYRVFVWHRAGGFAGGTNGRFGYELEVKPKETTVKDYALAADAPAKK